MAEKKLVIVPSMEHKAAPIPFAVVSGDGVPNHDEDGFIYLATVGLSKKQAKELRGEVLEFWEDHKPKAAKEKPANWDGITYKTDDGDIQATFRTQVSFGEKKNKISIVDGQQNKLDPDVFGSIGAGSTGRIVVGMKMYKSKNKYGVSLFLEAIRLVTFSAYVGTDATAAFGDEDEGDALSDTPSKAEKKAKKKKKKSKK